MSLHHVMSSNGLVVLRNNPEYAQGGPIKITQRPYAGEITHQDLYQAEDQSWMLQLDFFGFPKRFDVDEPERMAQELMTYIKNHYPEVKPEHGVNFNPRDRVVKMQNKVLYRGLRSYESYFIYDGYLYRLLRLNGDVMIRRSVRLVNQPIPNMMGDFYSSNKYNTPAFVWSILDRRRSRPDYVDRWWKHFSRSVDRHYPQTTEVLGCPWPEVMKPHVLTA